MEIGRSKYVETEIHDGIGRGQTGKTCLQWQDFSLTVASLKEAMQKAQLTKSFRRKQFRLGLRLFR
jgi:hypothetical protein